MWRYDAEPDDGSHKKLVLDAQTHDTDNVEGVAIYNGGDGKGYLVASIQGSWTFQLYSRTEDPKTGEYVHLGTFSLHHDDQLVESHDCIEITNTALGPDFPNGLFITQDYENVGGVNYKLVDWGLIAEAFTLPMNPESSPYPSE